MIKDSFINLYLNALLEEIRSVQEGLGGNRFDTLYEVGKLQGKLEGLRAAILVLENLAEDQDR